MFGRLVLCAVTLFLLSAPAMAQGSVAALISEITPASMPKGAERILPDSVPAEFGQAFDKLLAEGQGKIEGRVGKFSRGPAIKRMPDVLRPRSINSRKISEAPAGITKQRC